MRKQHGVLWGQRDGRDAAAGATEHTTTSAALVPRNTVPRALRVGGHEGRGAKRVTSPLRERTWHFLVRITQRTNAGAMAAHSYCSRNKR